MLKPWSQVLAEAGKPTEIFETGDGSRLLVLPYGARVLGLFTAEEEESFFWSNPALGKPELAEAFFASSGWHNSGGDRTWLAPELDLFYPNAQAEQYVQPRQLDMSDYAVERTDGGLSLSRQMKLHMARSGRDVELRLRKWFGPAANPLRHERDMVDSLLHVRYAGYTQRTSLELLGDHSRSPAALGIWNLLQLPPGGELFVPTLSRAAPQHYFGEIPAKYVSVEDHMLRVVVDFPNSHKIGLRSTILCGRAGYLFSQGLSWCLVVRNFFVNPSGEYVDVRKSEPEDLGYAFQACRVDEPEFGSFFELEYHAPALGSPPNPRYSEDVSQVWAFRGTRAHISAVAQKLLGVVA